MTNKGGRKMASVRAVNVGALGVFRAVNDTTGRVDRAMNDPSGRLRRPSCGRGDRISARGMVSRRLPKQVIYGPDTRRGIFCLSLLVVLLALFGLAANGFAAPPVSYSRQILPMLKVQCAGCHGGANPASGYSMDTRELLLKGGRHGPAIQASKGGQSAFVRYLTGDLQPKMPPNGAIDKDRIALIRRWIDEGAKVDSLIAAVPVASGSVKSALPPAVSAASPAPVTALAFAPDGKLLAAGGYRVVRLLDAATGVCQRVVPGMVNQVQALAWSSDGKVLAAAGGEPGQSGEIVLLDAVTWKPIRTLTGHSEVVCAAAWKPGSQELATGSLDKTVRVWNTKTGECLRTIKDHADAVFSVAYAPDGKLLATGSGDRSVKLFDTATWKRVASLTAHQDAVMRVAFSRDGTLLATASADKQLRVWRVKIGDMENPQRTQYEDDVINDCAFSPDGNWLAFAACDHRVKLFSGDGSQFKHEMKEPQDWVYSVAFARDSETMAAGTQDGKVLFWNVKEGKLLRSVVLTPGNVRVETVGEKVK